MHVKVFNHNDLGVCPSSARAERNGNGDSSTCSLGLVATTCLSRISTALYEQNPRSGIASKALDMLSIAHPKAQIRP